MARNNADYRTGGREGRQSRCRSKGRGWGGKLTFPHSSQWWTRWPLVALLTRPVRVYLIDPGASGGVISREDPRWGLPRVNVRGVGERRALFASA